jgi:predicted ribosomally synthesized peptide with SipW-like signal peptide
MSEDKFNLSRRKALAALGTIGVASAGAGLGTSAYFSDQETFENNQLTAGTLDLTVEASVYEYQGAANDGGQSFSGVQNGQEPTIKQQLTDLKPGDYSWGKFCFSIVDNPGYIWAGGDLVAESENGKTEPEADDPDEGPGVELANEIQAVLFYAPTDFDPSGQGRPTEASFDNIVFEGTLRETLAYLGTGVPLDADPGSSGRQAFTGTPEQSFDDDVCLGFAWYLPLDHANEIQTDTATFDIDFVALQERHNEGDNNPFADAVLTSDASGGIRETDNWITASVNAGPTTAINIQLDGEVYGNEDDVNQEVGDQQQGEPDLPEWPSNASSYFMEANVDIGNDGIDEAANDDDFRVGYAAANSGARAGAISNSQTGASGNGGYIRRNTGGPSGSANRTDVAEEDVPGFTAYESADQLEYTFVLDWSQIAADGEEDTAELSSAPSEIQINEIFGGDGGEGVGANETTSDDGRESVDNVADGSSTLTL